MKKVTQKRDEYYSRVGSGPLELSDIEISNGGLLLFNRTPKKGERVRLKNVCSLKGSDKGGMYFVMLWPNAISDTKDRAIEKFTLDNSKCKGKIYQGSAEAALRGKCDDAKIIGATFVGFLKNGVPYKQVVQVRHGKKWLFQKCVFENSWPSIGRQKTAGKGWEMSQQVGTVIFDQCTFTKWTPSKDLISRSKGVDQIIYTNCIDPSGKKFSKTI